MLTLAVIISVLSAWSQALNTGLSHAIDLREDQFTPGGTLPYFYLLEPTWVCVNRASADGAVEGGQLDETEAWVSFGIANGRYTIWRSDSGYRRMPVDAFNVRPLGAGVADCGTS